MQYQESINLEEFFLEALRLREMQYQESINLEELLLETLRLWEMQYQESINLEVVRHMDYCLHRNDYNLNSWWI